MKNYFISFRWGTHWGDAIITDQETIRTQDDLEKIRSNLKKAILKDKNLEAIPKDDLLIINISAL